jgi:hypothetical protein
MKLNKYYDDAHVKTTDFNKLSSKSLREIRDFLQSNYIPSDQFMYTITRRHLKTAMIGHDRNCYVSTYLAKSSPDSPIELVGCVFSKPITIEFQIKDQLYQENANIVDFLCVRRDKQADKLIRPLFQTHEKNVRIDSQIPITLFKKEVDLCEGVVPLFTYNTFTFHIERRPIEKMPDGITCSKAEFNELIDFVKMVKPTYSFVALPCVGNIIEFINREEWWVYCVRNKQDILGMYIFKNAHLTSDVGNGRTIELVSAIPNTKNVHLFYVGFLQSFKNVLVTNPNVKWLVLNDIGGANILANSMLNEKMQMMSKTPAAIFLFNYVLPNNRINKETSFLIL